MKNKMKYIVIIGDGMADFPIEKFGNKTPLEIAKKPNLNFITGNGKCGMLKTIPDNMEPGSDVANLSILGYDPERYYTGRAPLEAAARGIKLEPGQIAFRTNFITERDGILEDSNAEHIETKESKVLIESLNENLKEIKKVGGKFYSGLSYRNLFISNSPEAVNLISKPPHDIIGEKIKDNLIKGKTRESKIYAQFLNDLMLKSKKFLESHRVNKERLKNNKKPANMIWFWGQGSLPKLQPFEEKYGLKGAIISAVDLIKGIGKLAKMEVIEVKGATGFWETNYEGKASACLKALNNHDFVYLHIEAPDEAGHSGDADLKVKVIEDIDKRLVGKILKGIKKRKIEEIVKIAILPDHPTPIKVRTHTRDLVPFVIYSKNPQSDKPREFSEKECQKGSYGKVKIGEFIKVLLNQK